MVPDHAMPLLKTVFGKTVRIRNCYVLCDKGGHSSSVEDVQRPLYRHRRLLLRRVRTIDRDTPFTYTPELQHRLADSGELQFLEIVEILDGGIYSFPLTCPFA